MMMSVRSKPGAIAILAVVLVSSPALADDRRQIELGVGLAFDVLGGYDVGKELGGPAVRSDLGPATLGVYVSGGIWISPTTLVGLEGTLAVGGLVRTDERYFETNSNVGSTLTVSSKLVAAWRFLERGKLAARAGLDAGIERMSEATSPGSVHLDSLVGGPWIGLDLGRFVQVQLRVDLHFPVRASISKQASGDPSGAFASAGVRVAFVFGVGPRLRTSAGSQAAPSAAPAAAE